MTLSNVHSSIVAHRVGSVQQIKHSLSLMLKLICLLRSQAQAVANVFKNLAVTGSRLLQDSLTALTFCFFSFPRIDFLPYAQEQMAQRQAQVVRLENSKGSPRTIVFSQKYSRKMGPRRTTVDFSDLLGGRSGDLGGTRLVHVF